MIGEMLRLLRILLHGPGSTVEFVVSGALAVLGFFLAFGYIGSVSEMKMVRTARSVVVLLLSLVVGLLAATLTQNIDGLPEWGKWVGAGLALAIVVAPATCFICKGGYLAGLLTLAVGIGAALLLSLFSHTVFSGINKGESSMGKGIEHKRQIEEFVGE